MNKFELIHHIASVISGKQRPPIPLIMYLVHYYEIKGPLTFQEIGTLFGVTRARIHSIYRNVLKKLSSTKYMGIPNNTAQILL